MRIKKMDFRAKNTHSNVAQLNAYLKALLEKSRDVFWVRSADYSQQIYVSPAYETIWGRSCKSLYEHPEKWIETLFPEDLERLQKDIGERNPEATPGQKFFQWYRIVRPDGEIRWIEDESFAIFNEQGEHIGFAGISSDVTKNKLIEENLRKAKQDAEEANQLKTHFINNMQHDIRTPISGIWGVTQHLSETEADPKKKELLIDLANCSQELLEYCNDLVDFTNIEYNSRPVTKKSFDLRKVLETSIAIQAPAAKAKNLELSLICDSQIPTTIMGDSYRIKRILLNLLSNAIKFTKTGYVKLKANLEKPPNHRRSLVIRFAVEDSGIGIPDDKKEMIYEKFMRVDPSNRGIYKGSGLGLRVVKQFVEELNGDIHVESVLNKGTTFIVDLPLTVPLSDSIVDDEKL